MNVYEMLGVKQFRNLLFKLNDNSKYHLKRYKTLEGYKDRTERFEKLHWVWGTVLAAASIPFLVSDQKDLGDLVINASLQATNVISNFYPIMLQRYTRERLNEAIARKNKINYLEEGK